MSEQAKNYSPVPAEPIAAAPPCPSGQTYTVRAGDTLFFIAKRFNISLQSLIDANPQISDPNLIFSGQVICIPGPVSGAFCQNGQIYRVVSGDTIYEIAKSFGIAMDDLLAANPQISDPNMIFPGQEICVPVIAAAPEPTVSCPTGMLYTVQPGDTMFDIARRNNILLDALISANPQIADPNLIFPGQLICIPAGILPEVPAPAPAPLPVPPPMPTPMMPMPKPPMPAPMPMPRPVPFRPMPAPMPMPPPMPMPTCPMPAPMPMPPAVSPIETTPELVPTPPPPARLPVAPRPCPKPAPPVMPPVVSPIARPQQPVQPFLPSPLPQPMPQPLPTPMGYPGGEMEPMPMMCQPMPVFLAVPWSECPYRFKKKKHRPKRCR